jgi:hypothetical protein
MDDTWGEEAESWYYSYDGWASKKREEIARQRREQAEQIEGEDTLSSKQPDDLDASYINQSFLTGEADLIEVEQQGQQITLKIYKGGISGKPTRITVSPKEARTLIMMLATAIEGGPFPPSGKGRSQDGFDL